MNRLLGVSSPKCWTGQSFVDVHVEPFIPHDKDDLNYVALDAVTTIAEDSTYCPLADLWVRYHWMPPWVSRRQTVCNDKRQDACKAGDHAILALRDFLETKPYNSKEDGDWLKAYLPRRRLDQLNETGLLPVIRDPHGVKETKKRYHTLRIPATSSRPLCENVMSQQGRDHALAYINTVLAIRSNSLKRYKGVVEVKDDGPKLKPDAYRRLRRALTMCAVKTRYAPKVHRCKSGKNRPYRRTMKLAFDDEHPPEKRCLEVKENDCDNELEFFARMKISPKASLQPATFVKRPNTTGHNWYRVTIEGSESLIVEGVMVKLVKKGDKKRDTTQELTLIPPETK